MANLAGIKVTALLYENKAWENKGSGISDSSGVYTITGLPEGDYAFKFEDLGDSATGRTAGTYPTYFSGIPGNNFPTLDQVVPVLAGVPEITTVNVPYAGIGQANTAAATFLSSNSGVVSALAGMKLTAIRRNDDVVGWTNKGTSTSDSSGIVIIAGLPEGYYVFKFEDMGDSATGRTAGTYPTLYRGDRGTGENFLTIEEVDNYRFHLTGSAARNLGDIILVSADLAFSISGTATV